MMKLGANLNGFTIVTEPTNNDAGMSQWCHAEREGQRYFMKMYLSPKYPTASAPGTAAGKERRRVECERFEQRQLAIVKRLRPDGPGGGHLVTTLAFFRVGPCYYKITRLIDIDKDVRLQDFAPDAQSVALRSLLFALKLMHDVDIVHGDLKPENVLFERTSAGAVLCKLIDFDEAYVSGEPPDVLTIVGDPRYYSPELYRYVKQDGTVAPSDLSLKADIFALGLLIHILLTGAFPLFDESVYGYPCEAVVGEAGLTFHHALPTGPIRATLAQMLHVDPAARPGIDEVIEAIRGNDLRAAAESIRYDAGGAVIDPLEESLNTVILSKELPTPVEVGAVDDQGEVFSATAAEAVDASEGGADATADIGLVALLSHMSMASEEGSAVDPGESSVAPSSGLIDAVPGMSTPVTDPGPPPPEPAAHVDPPVLDPPVLEPPDPRASTDLAEAREAALPEATWADPPTAPTTPPVDTAPVTDPDATPPGGTPRLRSTFNRRPATVAAPPVDDPASSGAEAIPEAVIPEADATAEATAVVPAEAHPEHGAATGGLVAFIRPDHGRGMGARERGRGRPGSVDVGWPSW